MIYSSVVVQTWFIIRCDESFFCQNDCSQSLSSSHHNYRVEHNRLRSAKFGSLSTTLAEDVFSLLRAEANVLVDYIVGDAKLPSDSRTGACLFVDGIEHVFQVLKQSQMSSRLCFLTTLEDCAAAANDFFRMSELMEVFLGELLKMIPSLSVNSDLSASVLQEGNVLITLFTQDAVMAAERTQVFIMRAVQSTSISSDFFSLAWENDWTQNEVSFSMVAIFDEYLIRTKRYLANDFLYHKAVAMSARAMTCFYIRCLINKADSVTRRRRNRERVGLHGERQPFQCHARAQRRLGDDIKVMINFFRESSGGDVTLLRIIANEMHILELIRECLGTEDAESLKSFIVVIHKRTGTDPLVTRYFVGDLWILTAHKRGRANIQKAVQQLQPDLQMVTARMKHQSFCSYDELSFVRLDNMLKVLYEDRVAQGMLPACWACLPKVETEGNEVVAKQIRNLTRKMVEMKWGKNQSR